MSSFKKAASTTVVVTVLSLAIAAPSMAAPCRDDKGLARKVFTEFQAACQTASIGSLSACGKAGKIVNAIAKIKTTLSDLGVTVGNNWLTLGTPESGRFSAAGNPRFTTLKTVDKDSVKITLDKTGGKGGVAAVICATDANGTTKLGEIEIEDGSRDAVSKNLTVTGAKDKILQVQLNGIGSALQTMKFKLNAQ